MIGSLLTREGLPWGASRCKRGPLAAAASYCQLLPAAINCYLAVSCRQLLSAAVSHWLYVRPWPSGQLLLAVDVFSCCQSPLAPTMCPPGVLPCPPREGMGDTSSSTFSSLTTDCLLSTICYLSLAIDYRLLNYLLQCGGFERHVRDDHNIWAYLGLMVH